MLLALIPLVVAIDAHALIEKCDLRYEKKGVEGSFVVSVTAEELAFPLDRHFKQLDVGSSSFIVNRVRHPSDVNSYVPDKVEVTLVKENGRSLRLGEQVGKGTVNQVCQDTLVDLPVLKSLNEANTLDCWLEGAGPLYSLGRITGINGLLDIPNFPERFHYNGADFVEQKLKGKYKVLSLNRDEAGISVMVIKHSGEPTTVYCASSEYEDHNFCVQADGQKLPEDSFYRLVMTSSTSPIEEIDLEASYPGYGAHVGTYQAYPLDEKNSGAQRYICQLNHAIGNAEVQTGPFQDNQPTIINDE